ncbi:MAG: anti-sigma factor antagonist [Solirubrobacterales bacterium]|nr:anti-sigma factor antagonist [Solirubrobacterales bacterium]
MGVHDQLQIEVRHDGGRAVLALVGELDMASADRLQQAIADDALHADTSVVLDLEGLQFIDSTGLRVILRALERCRGRGQEFAITRGSPQVQRLLSITGVATHLPTISSTDEMVA